MTIVALLVLAVGTYAMKVAGPLAVGGRELPPTLGRLVELLPAALLAALVATQTIGARASLTLDARIVGVAVAGLAVMRGAQFGVVVLIGAGATALVRLAGWG